MTPPSPGKRPKSFMVLDAERFASRKSANCSGNVEAVDGFCGSLCSRAPPIARPKRDSFITGERPTCCATLNQLAAKELLQSYFDRWQIEINHRDEKSILGVGHAQVWADLSVPRLPAFMVATYSLMLLSILETYGPTRTNDYEPLPKWRNAARRPSRQDAITLLRKQIEAKPTVSTKKPRAHIRWPA